MGDEASVTFKAQGSVLPIGFTAQSTGSFGSDRTGGTLLPGRGSVRSDRTSAEQVLSGALLGSSHLGGDQVTSRPDGMHLALHLVGDNGCNPNGSNPSCLPSIRSAVSEIHDIYDGADHGNYYDRSLLASMADPYLHNHQVSI